MIDDVGTFETEVINPNTHQYSVDASMKVLITVVETFDNDHQIVSKREAHSGRLTFTAADSGQHKICFTPETDVATGGWLTGPAGAVKFTVDLAIGETSKIETEDKDKMKDLVQRVKDLNSRLHDIRREQVYQRVSFVCLVPFQRLMNVLTPFLFSLSRNVRPNSATSPRQPTPASCAGPSSK